MTPSTQEQNKTLVLRAFDLLFNKRDYAAAEKFWSPQYIQHSAHIEPGREGLFNLIKSLPATLRYEAGLVVAEGDFVIAHGRFSGFGAMVNWIAADILRSQDEASEQQSRSKAPCSVTHFRQSVNRRMSSTDANRNGDRPQRHG